MPENNPLESITTAFMKSFELYNVGEAIILFIVTQIEKGLLDQRHLEYEIYKKIPNVRIERTTLANLNENSYLDEDKRLY